MEFRYGGVLVKRYALIQLKETGNYHVWDRCKQMISDSISESVLFDDDGAFIPVHEIQVRELTDWRSWEPSSVEFFFRGMWGPAPPYGTEKVVSIDEISLPKAAKTRQVKESELAPIRFHVQLFGQLDQPLLVKENNRSLIGNIEQYLVAREAGLQVVPVSFA